MIKKNKKAVEKLTMILLSIGLIVVLAIIMIYIMQQSNEVRQTAWDKIKNLNPFV